MGQGDLEEALLMMTKALVLLDRRDEGLAAVHLQHAIDVTLGKRVPSCDADLGTGFDAEVAAILR